jgi:hypothetical protein
MSTVFVVFPPGGGGNHLRNIIVSCYKDTDILTLYGTQTKTVHFFEPGNNLQYNQIENAVSNQDQIHVLHGHFGEVMSFQQQVRSIVDKKFIILSPDTPNDRKLLNERRKSIGYINQTDDYFDAEQVFLYEPFMYHWYFQVPMDNIMNISISEWFVTDIDSVLDRISYFLKLPMNKEQISNIHNIWVKVNK